MLWGRENKIPQIKIDKFEKYKVNIEGKAGGLVGVGRPQEVGDDNESENLPHYQTVIAGDTVAHCTLLVPPWFSGISSQSSSQRCSSVSLQM